VGEKDDPRVRIGGEEVGQLPGLDGLAPVDRQLDHVGPEGGIDVDEAVAEHSAGADDDLVPG